jgi:hypothetical protein
VDCRRAALASPEEGRPPAEQTPRPPLPSQWHSVHRSYDVASLWHEFLQQSGGIRVANQDDDIGGMSSDGPESLQLPTEGSPLGRTSAVVASEDVSVQQRFELAPTTSPVVLSAARKSFQRKHLADYMHCQKSGERPKTQIPTDANGEITALKSVFHRAIRDIAGRVLDLSVMNFNEHPAICLNYINHDLSKQFVFNPALRPNYVVDYLKESISNSRYRWRWYWKKNGAKHPMCPMKRYAELVTYWQTPEAEEDSRRMRRHRSQKSLEFQCDVASREEEGEGRESVYSDGATSSG